MGLETTSALSRTGCLFFRVQSPLSVPTVGASVLDSSPRAACIPCNGNIIYKQNNSIEMLITIVIWIDWKITNTKERRLWSVFGMLVDFLARLLLSSMFLFMFFLRISILKRHFFFLFLQTTLRYRNTEKKERKTVL